LEKSAAKKHFEKSAAKNAKRPLEKSNHQLASREETMSIHLQNSDVVMIIALALMSSLLLALRFRPSNWKTIVLEALAANAAAIIAVVAFEMMLS
jgi:hypothetical protein